MSCTVITNITYQLRKIVMLYINESAGLGHSADAIDQLLIEPGHIRQKVSIYLAGCKRSEHCHYFLSLAALLESLNEDALPGAEQIKQLVHELFDAMNVLLTQQQSVTLKLKDQCQTLTSLQRAPSSRRLNSLFGNAVVAEKTTFGRLVDEQLLQRFDLAEVEETLDLIQAKHAHEQSCDSTRLQRTIDTLKFRIESERISQDLIKKGFFIDPPGSPESSATTESISSSDEPESEPEPSLLTASPP